MTLQVKRRTNARISALTIRNTLRGANETGVRGIRGPACKVPRGGQNKSLRTLVSEDNLEFDKRYKELANPYCPARRAAIRHVPIQADGPGEKLAKRPPSARCPAEGQRPDPSWLAQKGRRSERDATLFVSPFQP